MDPSPTTHLIYSPHRNVKMTLTYPITIFISLCMFTVVTHLGWKVYKTLLSYQEIIDSIGTTEPLEWTEPDQEDES